MTKHNLARYSFISLLTLFLLIGITSRNAHCEKVRAYPNHLIILIDASGSMRRFTDPIDLHRTEAEQRFNDLWGPMINEMLGSIPKHLAKIEEQSGTTIYDSSKDYISVFFFGLPKSKSVSFQNDFIKPAFCWKKNVSINYIKRNLELKFETFNRDIGVLTWAVPLGFRKAGVCSPNNIRVSNSYILMLTDGKANWSVNDSSEISTIKRFVKEKGIKLPLGQGFNYCENLIRGMSEWYNFTRESYVFKNDNELLQLILIKVHNNAYQAAFNMTAPLREVDLIRKGNTYKRKIGIEITPSNYSSYVQPIKFDYQVDIGKTNWHNTISLLDRLDHSIDIVVQSNNSRGGDQGSIDISYLFKLDDPWYGKHYVNVDRDGIIKVPEDLTIEPFGFHLPDILFELLPEASPNEISYMIYLIGLLGTISIALAGGTLGYLFFSRPNHRIYTESLAGSENQTRTFEIKAGYNVYQNKELIDAYQCVDRGGKHRFGFIKTRKKPFSLEGQIYLNNKINDSIEEAIGFSWGINPELRLPEVYPNTPVFLFFNPSSINIISTYTDDQEIPYTVRFRADGKDAGSHKGILNLTYVPELATPMVQFNSINSAVEHKRDIENKIIGDLRIENSASHALSESLHCTCTIELRPINPDGPPINEAIY